MMNGLVYKVHGIIKKGAHKKMKKIIVMLTMFCLMSSLVFATVSRNINGNQITYSTTIGGSYDRAYWAVRDTVGSGCTGISVVCTGTNIACDYSNNEIRLVANTPDGGGTLESSTVVTVTGDGACTLNNGEYVESTPGNLGSPTPISGSGELILGAGGPECNTDADGMYDGSCDGCVDSNEWISNGALDSWYYQSVDPDNGKMIDDIEWPAVQSAWYYQTGCSS